jgi:hypothetical protein
MRLASIWRLWAVVCVAVPAGQAVAQETSPSPPAYTATAESVMASLNDVLSWYRQAKVVTQSVSHPSGAPLARDGEQLALRVVERAFETARASLPLIPRESAREGDPRERRTNQLEELTAAIRRREEEVARLRARARAVRPRDRPALERELATGRNLLELDRARLDFAAKLSESATALRESDSDLARQIQALQDAVPGLKAATAQPGPAPAVEAETAGTWGLVRRLLAVRRSRNSLGALKGATAELQQNVEHHIGAIRGELRPIRSRLRALAENPTLSGTTLAEGEREFRDLLERRKALVAVMLPLRGQLTFLRQFSDDLQGWDQVLDRQSRQLLQGIGLDFLRVGIALLIILIGALFWRVTVRRYVSDPYRRRLMMSTRNVVVLVAITLVLIFHFTSELATLVTVLGFAAAGIAFALQTVILAFAGYFSMVAPNGIRVGEYVALQGPFGYVHGEVMDIGFVRMRLRELAGDPLRPTGRVVVFPNSVVFTGGFFKHPAPPAPTDPAHARDQRAQEVGPDRGGKASAASLGGR